MRLAIAILGLAGCWSETSATSEPTTPQVVPPVVVQHEAPRDPTRMHQNQYRPKPVLPPVSTWHGWYMCSQGITDVTLTIEINGVDGHQEAIAIFDFGPHPSNSMPKKGATKLKGPVTELAGGEFTVDLDPFEWVVQPPGYIMVGMTGTTDGQQKRLEGRMKSSSCGEIKVERVD